MAKFKAKNKYDLLCISLRGYSDTIAKIVFNFSSKLFTKKELHIKEQSWNRGPYYHFPNWEPINEFYDKYYTNDFKTAKSQKYKNARKGIKSYGRDERLKLIAQRHK